MQARVDIHIVISHLGAKNNYQSVIRDYLWQIDIIDPIMRVLRLSVVGGYVDTKQEKGENPSCIKQTIILY